MHDSHLGSEHTSKAFDAEFTRLVDEILRMGALASSALTDVMHAFAERDAAGAEAVLRADRQIDALEQQVNQDALRLLALRQPIARDLREIVAALRIATAIERIGDYAANIAKRVRALVQTDPTPISARLIELGRLAQSLLDDVLAAYRQRDAEAAYRAWQRDTDLDREHSALFADLLERMAAEPNHVPACAHLMFVARNLERIGDHATNIAEQIHFVVHGTLIDETRTKQDTSSSIV